MADYLDFPDILPQVPIWAMIAAAVFLTTAAIKLVMRSLTWMLIGSLCAATIYLWLTLA